VRIQISHAGCKAGGAEVPVAPSAILFDERLKILRALLTGEVKNGRWI